MGLKSTLTSAESQRAALGISPWLCSLHPLRIPHISQKSQPHATFPSAGHRSEPAGPLSGRAATFSEQWAEARPSVSRARAAAVRTQSLEVPIGTSCRPCPQCLNRRLCCGSAPGEVVVGHVLHTLSYLRMHVVTHSPPRKMESSQNRLPRRNRTLSSASRTGHWHAERKGGKNHRHQSE